MSPFRVSGGTLAQLRGLNDAATLLAKRVKIPCMNKPSALADWTPEEVALGKRWVETWRLAAEDLERIRRKEIRELDTYKTISLLCKSADYTRPPYAPTPWSGLIEQQRWFKKLAGRE